MSFETEHGVDSGVVEEISGNEQPSDRLPLFNTLLAGYRSVGEHFLSFALVAILAAGVRFIFPKLLSAAGSPALFIPRGLLHYAAIPAGMVFPSVVLAVFGTSWYRRLLIGQRRPLRFGPQEARFAVVMILFSLVLFAPIEGARLDPDQSVRDRLAQLTGYPPELVWPTIAFLWRVLATALLFFTFPAIALDVQRPLAMRRTRRGARCRACCSSIWSVSFRGSHSTCSGCTLCFSFTGRGPIACFSTK